MKSQEIHGTLTTGLLGSLDRTPQSCRATETQSHRAAEQRKGLDTVTGYEAPVICLLWWVWTAIARMEQISHQDHARFQKWPRTSDVREGEILLGRESILADTHPKW